MFYKTLVALAVVAGGGFGAMSLSSTPASAQGYCYYHPHDPVCLAGVVAPYVAHHAYHEHYDDYDDHYDHHHHDHDHDHHHHDHDHDHDHHHDHDHDHHHH